MITLAWLPSILSESKPEHRLTSVMLMMCKVLSLRPHMRLAFMLRSRTAPSGEDDVRVRVVPGPRGRPEVCQPFETEAVAVPLSSMTASSSKAEAAATAARRVDDELAVI